MDLLTSYLQQFQRYDTGEVSYPFCNLEFLKENLPVFECSDKQLEEIYYFRAYTMSKHIKRNRHGKYIISEFLTPVSWATETDGAIGCPLGHHLAEYRWLKNTREIVKEYIVNWFSHKDALLLYNNWFAYGVYNWASVTGEWDFAYSIVDDLISYFDAFCENQRAENGMYKGVDNYDGMELSISAIGIRCTVNAYIYGNAYGIYKILEKQGDSRAERYAKFANELKTKINAKLFVEDFYYHQPLNDGETISKFHPNFTNPSRKYGVKELSGYVPFYFGIPEEKHQTAWKYLVDERVFKDEYGLTTADKSDEQFRYPFNHMCLWNGPVWPFATSQTLTGLIDALKRYGGAVPITADDFCDALCDYAKSQHITENGVMRPWIDENLDGATGEWIAKNILSVSDREDKYRGKDYNHSTYLDLIISGLCGVTVTSDKVEFKPLIGKRIQSFSLSGVKVGEKLYDIKYDTNGYRVTERKIKG